MLSRWRAVILNWLLGWVIARMGLMGGMPPILISVKAPCDMRYFTAGDWYFRHGVLHIDVVHMSDWRSIFMVATHELIEALRCTEAGVTEKMVDEFDMAYDPKGDPGMNPKAPYYKQHIEATLIEMNIGSVLGVCWDRHNNLVVKGKV